MNKLIKALFIALPLALMGCDDAYDTTVNTAGYPASGSLNNGCIIVSDATYGEREVCSQYYVANGGYVWWDPNFGIWVSNYGYYRAGVWYRGFYPGYHNYYHGYYHPHGYYYGHPGYGGGWHGSWHGGGGGHFGGHGGHR
jgi:hypothetical protein